MAEIDRLRKKAEGVLTEIAVHPQTSERDALFWDIIEWILDVTGAHRTAPLESGDINATENDTSIG